MSGEEAGREAMELLHTRDRGRLDGRK